MYPTPDTLPADTVCRVLRIPNDLNYLMAVDELISRLGIESYWEQTPGGITPELAAARAARMFKEYLDEECTPVSTVAPFVLNMYGSTSKQWNGILTQSIIDGPSLGSTILDPDFWYEGRSLQVKFHGRMIGGTSNRLVSLQTRINNTLMETLAGSFTVTAGTTFYMHLDMFIYCESVATNAALQCSGLFSILPAQAGSAIQVFEAFRVTDLSLSASISHEVKLEAVFNTNVTDATVIGDYCLIRDVTGEQ